MLPSHSKGCLKIGIHLLLALIFLRAVVILAIVVPGLGSGLRPVVVVPLAAVAVAVVSVIGVIGERLDGRLDDVVPEVRARSWGR